MKELFFIICHISTIVAMICSWVLFSIRNRGDVTSKKDSMTLMLIFATMSVIFAIRALSQHVGLELQDGSSCNVLLFGLYTLSTISIYPLRGIFYGHLHDWRAVKIYMPFFFFQVLIYFSSIFKIGYPAFDPWQRVVSGDIYEFNIIVRYLILLSAILISLFTAYASYKYSKRKVFRHYSTISLLYGLCFTLLFFDNEHKFTYVSMYQIVAIFFMVYITLLKVAEQAPSPKEGTTEEEIINEIIIESNPLLWAKLESYMRSKDEPWRKPELTISMLATQINSNRTSISNEIHTHSFLSFYDYVAEYRIEAFCKTVKKNHNANITQTLIDVGFNSKSTGFRHFKRLHNCTPTQYIESLRNSHRV